MQYKIMSDDDSNKNGLKNIKSTAFSRNISLFKLSVSSGLKGMAFGLSQLAKDGDENSQKARTQWLISQADMLVKELGQLKGSVMKVGQMLSVYGEHFLPPEVNQILKRLQNQTPPLNWGAIEKCLRSELTADQLALLNINPQALACASLGQVHRATYNGSKQIVLKVQYPGVDKAIDSDLKTLRFVFGAIKILPQQERALDSLFEEVRDMLHQEVDYHQELAFTQNYRELYSNDRRFIIPEPFPEISTRKVIATSFEDGLPIDSPQIQNLSQERRNRLALAYLDLYFQELMKFGTVQTDPHFGNYKIRLDPLEQNDQWVLFDFGAVRKFKKSFTHSYAKMVRGSIDSNAELLLEGAIELGFIRDNDPVELKHFFTEFCYLMVEPFQLKDGQIQIYDWGKSSVPNQIIKKATHLIRSFHSRVPPREIVFLDRKSAGTFTVLAKLRAQIDGRSLLLHYLDSSMAEKVF